MLLEQLFEAVSSSKVNAAMSKIVSYLEKNLNANLIRVPGVEHFKNSKDEGYGIRFFMSGTKQSLRFNWVSSGQTGKSAAISSIDYWSGASRDPSVHIQAKGVSLVKVLPSVVSQLLDPSQGSHTVFVSDNQLTEARLFEAKRGEYNAQSALKSFLSRLKNGETFTRSFFAGEYHIENAGIFDTVFGNFGNLFTIQGKRISWKDGADVNEIYKEVLGEAPGELLVSSGGKGEQYLDSPGEQDLEKDEHVSFSESLEHLEDLVGGVVKGAFNALFVAGAGGVGKTQTVEDTLEGFGLSDGNGYFKNTGSASPFGIYEMLYKYRKGIILFDDSDGALADQDGRNLIKAATDTKKLRKIAWSKKNAKLYDPDIGPPKKKGKKGNDDDVDMDNIDDLPSDDDETPSDLVPSYFNFEGRIIFISNLSLDKLDPDGALRTRAFIISINPTNQEVYERMESILFKINIDGGSLTESERYEVLDVIKTTGKKGPANLRTLVRGLNIRASGAKNWSQLIKLYA